ncbi:MAG: HAMP domain-containing sensor histidine kinase [Phycisphaerales bacterium]
MRPVYLNDVMLETVAHCAVAAKQSNVAIIPELYDADEDLVVAGDPELLRVLFDNLLRNAVRFSPAGSTVVASVSFSPSDVTISITDAGPGIPSEILPRLFERFTQASQEIGRGHGLGLSIAQGIAELHGGLITVTNLAGGGCRFTLSLPRITAHPAHDGASSASQPAHGTNTAGTDQQPGNGRQNHSVTTGDTRSSASRDS